MPICYRQCLDRNDHLLMTDSLPPAIFIMGPTASGKTDLAMALMEHLPVDIISVDSGQIYRGMNVGTAKPDAATLARAPHRLIDIRDPNERYSAAEFCRDALKEMAEITAAGRIPLLAGGTMLYFRALEYGLSPLPEADAEVRAELEAEAAEYGWAHLHAQLAKIDPVSAKRIHQNDPQRIQRSLEVYKITGNTMTELYAVDNEHVLPYQVHKIAIAPPQREVLRERIAKRFYSMMEQGFLSEVEQLVARGDLDLDMPAVRTVGYRQLWRHVIGDYNLDEAINKGIIATRQLAKRQMTWLRSDPDAQWFDSTDPQLLSAVLKWLSSDPISLISDG